MNMIEAVKSVLTQYVGFSGRARRSEYWYWILATILVGIVVAIIELALGLSSEGSGPISGLLNLAVFLPGLAVSFRRLHDTGRSGWWIGGFYLAALAFIIIFVGIALSASNGTVEPNTTALASMGVIGIGFVIAVLVYAIVLLIFFCQDSDKGQNKYGPNPKNEGNYDVFE